ncbi:MAG: hypothetical protein H6815_05075 [Phycisphaeraceae bacterium]|nr:hypothetical protein [Phycisphaerales bacterium]MCB9859808.1 hypothetical protein [Phycisphaeraceae bacterium]
MNGLPYLMLLLSPCVLTLLGFVSYFAAVRVIKQPGRVYRMRALQGKGLCPVCRYDLAGLAFEAQCPECGATASDRDRTWMHYDTVPPSSRFGVVSIVCILGCLIVHLGVIAALFDPQIVGASLLLFPGLVLIYGMMCLPIIAASYSVAKLNSDRHYIWLVVGCGAMALIGLVVPLKSEVFYIGSYIGGCVLAVAFTGYVLLLLAVIERAWNRRNHTNTGFPRSL